MRSVLLLLRPQTYVLLMLLWLVIRMNMLIGVCMVPDAESVPWQRGLLHFHEHT